MEEDRAQPIPLLMPGEVDAPAAVVVAADPCLRRATALYLRLVRSYSVLATESVQQALERCGEFEPSLLLLHAERCRPWPAPQLHAWREHVGAPAVVMITDPDVGEVQALRSLGASEIVSIPVDPGRLMELVDGVLRTQASQR